MKFKIGDGVKLRKGWSPVMTVSEVTVKDMPDYVECTWYLSEEGKFKVDTLHQDILEKSTG